MKTSLRKRHLKDRSERAKRVIKVERIICTNAFWLKGARQSEGPERKWEQKGKRQFGGKKMRAKYGEARSCSILWVILKVYLYPKVNT